MAADTHTTERLQTLLRLYQSGYQSAIIDKTVAKLTALEIARLEDEAAQLRQRLTAFEQQYGMSTEAFYQRFQAGKMGDAMDFVEWSAFREMYQNTLERLALLTRSDIHAVAE